MQMKGGMIHEPGDPCADTGLGQGQVPWRLGNQEAYKSYATECFCFSLFLLQ